MDKDLSWNIVSLNFEFLLFLDHCDVTCDYPKGNVLGRRRILKHIVLGKNRRSYRCFVLQTADSIFEIPQICFVVSDFISIKHRILL